MLSIYINNELIDLQGISNLNIRLNKTLYDPSKLSGSTSEYSFSFNIPTTPTNNRIFNFVNSYNYGLATYNATLYNDEILLFKGSLIINSVEDGYYSVNLVNIKQNTVDTIFGDMTLNELEWSIPFNGDINEANKQDKVWFPLVSYGVFQKSPYDTIGDVNFYTSKFKLDDYVRYYYETFSPSVNVLELVRRLFLQKGYTLTGNIFNDNHISNIYQSTYLSNKQVPTYNLGNENLGSIELSVRFDNKVDLTTGVKRTALAVTQDLDFPLDPIVDDFNFDKVFIYDLLSQGSVVSQDEHYLFDKGDNCIVVPSNGWYKVDLQVSGNIPSQTVAAYDKKLGKNKILSVNMGTDMPIEVQFIKNDSVELIKGAKNYDGSYTAYPHEQLFNSGNPSKSYKYSSTNKLRPISAEEPLMNNYGYIPKEGEFLAYDPYVNADFIAGVSSLSSGTPSFIKNGYSWNPSTSDEIKSKYNCNGYWQMLNSNTTPHFVQTTFNKQTTAVDSSAYSSTTSFGGHVYGMIYLKKNDVLTLKAVSRAWTAPNDNNATYQFNVSAVLKFKAMSPNEFLDIKWSDSSQFPVDLKLGEFLNNEMKASDYINNFIKDFNLSYKQDGSIIEMNTQKLTNSAYAVDIDVDKANVERLEIPNKVAINYNINTEEWGYELTIPEDKLNLSNWADYGDKKGYNVELGGIGDEQSITLKDSYTWYDDFELTYYQDNVKRIPITVKIPVISKYSYMIDGYSYEESMKVDGKTLPYRYWYRTTEPIGQVKTVQDKSVDVYIPTGSWTANELGYYNIPYYKVMLSLKCYLTAKEYEILSKGGNVHFNKDIYKVSKINGYDPTGINTTELILIK